MSAHGALDRPLRIPSTRRAHLIAGLIAGLMLSGCGDRQPGPAHIAPQQWNQVRVDIQTQPDPPRPGANEVLVILAAPRNVTAYNSLVWLRTGDEDPWVQAIQDGHTGVYRRVVRLEPPTRATLQVRISRQDEQTVLNFPLIASH